MKSFTFQPNPTFQFSLLPIFTDGLEVNYTINPNNTVTFSSNNEDALQECWEQLYDDPYDPFDLIEV